MNDVRVDSTDRPKTPKNVTSQNATFEIPRFEMSKFELPAAIRDLAEKGGAPRPRRTTK
jgi:hypothetical protein